MMGLSMGIIFAVGVFQGFVAGTVLCLVTC